MWCRANDFYNVEFGTYQAYRELPIRRVLFSNCAEIVIIRDIEVHRYSNGQMEVIFHISPFHVEEIKVLSQKIFDNTEIIEGKKSQNKTLRDYPLLSDEKLILRCFTDTYIKILNFFSEINIKFSINEFDKEIRDEFLQLSEFHHLLEKPFFFGKSLTSLIKDLESQHEELNNKKYLRKDGTLFSHKVMKYKAPPLNLDNTSHIVHTLENYQTLLNNRIVYDHSLIKREKTYQYTSIQDPFTNLLSLLRKNHDPNEDVNGDGNVALKIAVELGKVDLIHLLMSYKANPFKRRMTGGGYTPFEDAKRLGNTAALTVFTAKLSKPEKPLIKVNEFKREKIGNTIYTYLSTATDLILLELSPTGHLTKEQLDELYKKYEEYFQKSQVCLTTLREFFDREVAGKKKFAERVMYNGKLAGLQLYEIITDPKYPNDIFFHISCIYIDEIVRGRGLTNPLSRTLIYTLQDLFSTKNISGNMQCISYGSWSSVAKFTIYPLYENPTVKNKVLAVFPHLQENPADHKAPPVLETGPTFSYSDIEVELARKYNIPFTTFDAALFNLFRGIPFFETNKHEFISDQELLAQKNYRGTNVFFYATDEDWEDYCKHCKQMNISPHFFIKDLSKHFRSFVADFTPEDNSEKTVSLPQLRLLFWSNLRKASNSAILPMERNIPTDKKP